MRSSPRPGLSKMHDPVAVLTKHLTLDQIVPDAVFVPRVSPDAAAWVPHKAMADQDAFTGGCLTVAGRMPVLCHAGVATPAITDLLADAGHDLTPNRILYRDFAEMNGLIRELVAEDRVMMLQHSWPASALPGGARTLVAPELQSYLNDKAHLDDLVPAYGRPKRRVLTFSAARGDLPEPPVVIKVGTALSSGAGDSVAICTTRDQVAAAMSRFAAARRLVFEELLDIRQNLCIQGAVMPDGSVRMLGGSEQITDAQGHYKGNRFDRSVPLNQTAVGLASQIIAAAAAKGYRGIAGVDIAVLRDGSVRAFDLNFRVNGSTAALLLLAGAQPAPLVQTKYWRCGCSVGDMLLLIRRWMNRGRLVPLSAFDPLAAGLPSERPRFSGLLLGESIADIARLEQEMAASGLQA